MKLYNPLSANPAFIFSELSGGGKSPAVVLGGQSEELNEPALQAVQIRDHDLCGLSAAFQRVSLYGLEEVDHSPCRWPTTGTALGIKRQGLDLLEPHRLAELPLQQGLDQTARRSTCRASPECDEQPSRYTGATSKSVFNCEKRFSIVGCRL